MKTTKKTATSKKTATKTATKGKEFLEYLDYVDRQDPGIKLMPVLCSLLMLHPDSEISAAARQHLSKWIRDCTGPEGVKDIVSCGFENGIPLLQILTTGPFIKAHTLLSQVKEARPQVETDEGPKYLITKQVEQFFRDLPPVAKIAVKLSNAIWAMQQELSETDVLDKLDDVISGCIDDIKTDDPELNQMLGLSRFMELTRDKNSITIAN